MYEEGLGINIMGARNIGWHILPKKFILYLGAAVDAMSKLDGLLEIFLHSKLTRCVLDKLSKSLSFIV